MTRIGYTLCLTAALVAMAGCSRPGGDAGDDSDGGAAAPATASQAASPAAAIADNGMKALSPMARKPGLWQLTQSLPNMPNAGIATKMCVDAAMGDRMATSAMAGMHDVACTRRDVTPTATGMDIAMICSGSGRTINSHIHVERVSDTEFHQTMNATFTPAVAGHETLSTTTTGKWLGACPADMKAGDVIVGNGMKMNILDAMAKAGTKAP